MAKRVQISSDDTTYYTLPGNSGEFRNEAGELDDTIFGQDYKSSEAGLISWTVQANAVYKGFAGYQVDIKKSGSATGFTTEACTLVSGKTYKITDTTKNVWDRTASFTIFDGGVDKTAFVESIDYLMGRVTFLSSYTVTGAVTVTGSSLAMTVLASYRNFTLTQTLDPIDNTDIPTAQANSGHRTFSAGLKTVSMEVSGVYASSNAYRTALVARTEVIIEINPNGSGDSIARGFFKYVGTGQSGNVGALEEETVSFRLQVPTTSLLYRPFSWVYGASTTLSTAVQKALDAFLAGSSVYVKYLADGSTGAKGAAVITDVTLSGGLDGMNEFSVNFQGSGALTTI